MRVVRIVILLLAAIVLTAGVWTGAPSIAAQTAGAPTFSRDIAPILYNRCVGCHRPGEVAPMSLITYSEVRPWAAAIRRRVLERMMPPWHADRRYGTFRNDTSLSDDEIDIIARWVEANAPEGDPADLPRLPEFPEGWQIGTPDVVFEMPVEYEVPATGTIEYQYFEVPTNFTEDMWMQAGEVRAGDREHVHHIIVYVREPERVARPTVMTNRIIPSGGATFATRPARQPPAAAPPAPDTPAPSSTETSASTSRPAGETPAPARPARAVTRGGDNMLVNWAVGEDAPVHAPGTAKRIPAGSTLVFQVHYTTNGTPGKDRSRVGLIFAKEPPAREVRTGLISNPLFAIPPGAPNHLVEAEATFTEDVKVWTMHPHMHLRGKDMTYTVTYPDGREQIVLRVPRFDFGWQTDYQLAEPLLLPKGSKLYVAAHFDNSPENRANPDPSATVRWGDQTWEEMMIGFFTYTVESGPSVVPAQP